MLVELAVNKDERAQGLMHRTSMPENDGMLFIYPDAKPVGFWMKNTKIPLSIAFITKQGEIVKIRNMEPHDQKTVKSVYPVKYALEMNQGWFERNNIEKGAMVTGIPKDADVGVQ